MQYKVIILTLLLVMGLGLKSPVQALTPTAIPGTPILMLIGTGSEGDLWEWAGPDEPLKQLTNWKYNFAPVVSPDGKYVAYLSVPTIGQNSCSGWPPFNIWVIEIATGQAQRIADQPSNATYCIMGATNSFIRRPVPAWSPDSKALAWGEESPESWTNQDKPVMFRLVIYDMVEHRQRIVLPQIMGNQDITFGQPVDWSPVGISASAFWSAFDDQRYTLTVYDTNGKVLYTRDTYHGGCPNLEYLSARWVKVKNKDFVYTCDYNKQYLIDPVSNREIETVGQLEMFQPNTPEGLSVYHIESDDLDKWHIALAGKTVKDIILASHTLLTSFDVITLSPDGQQVAYITNSNTIDESGDHLTIFSAQGDVYTTTLTLPQHQTVNWIGWGAKIWRVRE
jgi:hypothetical protein